MRMRIIVVAALVVLGVGVLQAFRARFALEPAAYALDEQAGSLNAVPMDSEDDLLAPSTRVMPKDAGTGAIVVDGNVRRHDDAVERQARQVYEQLKQRLAKGKNPSPRDADLKLALDRYFANSKIDQAIQLLEAVAKEAEGTPEASRAASAIQVLKRTSEDPLAEPIQPKPTTRRRPANENLGDYPTLVKPAKATSAKPRR